MKARLLFVTPEFPYPPASGGCLRTLSLMKELARSFEIHAVTFAQEPIVPGDLAALKPFLAEVTVLPLQHHRRSGLRRYMRNLRRAVRFIPPLVDRFSEPQLQFELARQMENQVDWVWLEHLWLAPYVESIPRSATKVLDVHNVESDFYRQLSRSARNPIERLVYRTFEHAARRVEQKYLPSFDKVLAVSSEDRRLLAHHCPPEKIFIVPNAVEISSPADDDSGSEQTLYFAGRLDYAPNREAVKWFHRRVWPLIRERFPAAQWTIVGAHPEMLDADLRRDSSIILTGQVETTMPYLHPCSLVIAPLTVGGGTRFKILEAWTSCKAVISTSKGAAGLLCQHGDNIWIANTPREFGDGVLGILKDSTLRRRLGKQGRKTVEKHYSWENLHLCLEAALGTKRQN
jgi:glycosyltransferase involved in cell wall biosynthesis